MKSGTLLNQHFHDLFYFLGDDGKIENIRLKVDPSGNVVAEPYFTEPITHKVGDNAPK